MFRLLPTKYWSDKDTDVKIVGGELLDEGKQEAQWRWSGSFTSGLTAVGISALLLHRRPVNDIKAEHAINRASATIKQSLRQYNRCVKASLPSNNIQASVSLPV